MSMQDPIADMFTRIRNALAVSKPTVAVASSNRTHAICEVLKEEGYINNCRLEKNAAGHKEILVELKYYEGLPAISTIKRVSRPGLRIYKGKDELPVVKNGLGIAIISTSKGVVSDRKARQQGNGGEVIGIVD